VSSKALAFTPCASRREGAAREGPTLPLQAPWAAPEPWARHTSSTGHGAGCKGCGSCRVTAIVCPWRTRPLEAWPPRGRVPFRNYDCRPGAWVPPLARSVMLQPFRDASQRWLQDQVLAGKIVRVERANSRRMGAKGTARLSTPRIPRERPRQPRALLDMGASCFVARCAFFQLTAANCDCRPRHIEHRSGLNHPGLA
jgi:hypothetical protein